MTLTREKFATQVNADILVEIRLLAQKEGRLRRGDKTLIVIGSAGVSVGLASFTY